MKDFLVKEIEPDSYFSTNTYLDKGFVLTAPEIPYTTELINLIDKWNYKSIFSEGQASKEYFAGNVRKNENDSSAGFSQQLDYDKLEKAEAIYSGFLEFTETVFFKAGTSDEFDINAISEKIKEIADYIKDDRRFLMRVLKNAEPADEKNYLSIHSAGSTILSLIIGSYLKLPPYRMIELGVASLMHEAGMLKLPPQIYLSQNPLNAQEQKAIMTHPVLGYSMLKAFGAPLPVCLAALEHHERENATGYPRRLPGDKISLYSKIIAVACSYEALSSKRPHKEAKDGYTGMLELLKNDGKRYDDTVVKALVISLSIYPIGLYVLLSSGKKGQVVDVNPENPRFPIVQVFGEYTPDGKIKLQQTAQGALTIIRPLNRTEIDS